MSPRAARVALVLALATGAGSAIASDVAAAEDLEHMTPAQLRELQAGLERENAAARDENAALRKRIEALEQRSAQHAAKKTELEARLAEVHQQLASLEASRKD